MATGGLGHTHGRLHLDGTEEYKYSRYDLSNGHDKYINLVSQRVLRFQKNRISKMICGDLCTLPLS